MPYLKELQRDDDDHGDDAQLGEEEDEGAHRVDGAHPQNVREQ